jgi:anthranilate phosphoribosyltransferase
MTNILAKLFRHQSLSATEAENILLEIANGKYSDYEVTAFTTVYLMRSITLPELQGFRTALLQLAMPCKLVATNSIDIVGTGGDGKNTFNISTLACFVVAGAGGTIIKHGNYSASSVSGSSNVLEQLGYRFSNDEAKLQNELDKIGICFLHAPLFHPALKRVAPMRKNLAVRTFFNMLGPLVNPARPSYQLIGTGTLEIARLYNYLLQQTEENYTIIHGLDGYDEISLTADTKFITPAGENIYDSVYLGGREVFAEDLSVGSSVDDAAALFLQILQGQGTWAQNAVVLANAAAAIHGAGLSSTYQQAYQQAVESLESKAALEKFTQLMNLQSI